MKKIVILTILFIIFTIIVLKGFLKTIDLNIGYPLVRLGSGPLGFIFVFFRHFGDFNINLSIVIIASIACYKFNLKRIAFLFLILFFSLTLTGRTLKHDIARQRPIKDIYRVSYENIISGSRRDAYPSGHNFTASYVFLSLGFIFSKKNRNKYQRPIKIAIYTIIFLVAVSSVCVSAHWITDCLGGFILGYIFYLILILSVSLLQA